MHIFIITMKYFQFYNKKIFIISSFSLFFCLTILAQPNEEYRKYKELAPNADVIATNYENSIDLSISLDNIWVNYKTKEEFFYIGNKINGYSERSINSSKFYVLKDYQAYTLKTSGNKYKKILVENFTKNTINNNGVFHDDNEVLNFILPQIEKGSKSVIETHYEITDPHILPTFSVSPYFDYYNVVFTLSFNENISVAIDTMNMSGIVLDHSISKNGNIIKHVWKFDSPKKLNYVSSGPGMSWIAPQIIIRIKSYINNGIKVQVLENLDDLYTWYCSLITKSSEDVNEFKDLSDSIVGNCDNNLEKASKIYDWVQKNIRYIAFEDGYAGLIPRKASTVYTERYGDCKGMANLLYHLLMSQKLDAHICWVGTRDLPYKYSKFPSPIVDNHMITALKNDSSYLFLDATHYNLAFGVPSPFIQGKEVLISNPNCNGYELAEIPEINAEKNNIYDSCVVIIQGKDLIGDGYAILSGDNRMSFIDGWEQKNYKFLLNYCRDYFLKGNNKFILDTVWIENLENKNRPLKIMYKFKIPDYVIIIDNECYINLNLDKVSIPSKINKERNVAIEYSYKSSEINIVNLNISSLGKINELPHNIYFNNNLYTFENNYYLTNDHVIRCQKRVNNRLILNPNEFIKFNNLIEIMQECYQNQLTFNTNIK